MAVFSARDRRVAGAIADIAFGNPFDTGRIALEREALGPDFVDAGPVIRVRSDASYDAMFPNVGALHRRAEALADGARQRLCSDRDATEADLRLYEDLACYVLYNRHMSVVHEPIRELLGSPDWRGPVERWPAFLADFRSYFEIPGRAFPSRHRPEHVFAVGFQVARAFHAIFEYVVGGSAPTARLRAAIWQSIFTHNMRRYMRAIYPHMVDIPTLITGPSGSGKELVARAVGQSLYAAFDPEARRFAGRRFAALNLSALAPTLIESELFGSVRGAFSEARDRAGWLEECGAPGAVNALFLDEVGELDAGIQVKLLRVLQDRRFARVGEASKALREFKGKVIVATNRDLAAEMRAGRFRPDFYYRLCADIITTPTLGDQLADRPEDLPDIVRFVVRRRVLRPDGPGGAALAGAELDALVDEVVAWIDGNLERGYPWPGNFRELEQCVRNLMIRNHYQPTDADGSAGDGDRVEAFLREVRGGRLTSEALLGTYYALVLRREGSYAAASRALGVDYRTLQKRIDPECLSTTIGTDRDDRSVLGDPAGESPGPGSGRR